MDRLCRKNATVWWRQRMFNLSLHATRQWRAKGEL